MSIALPLTCIASGFAPGGSPGEPAPGLAELFAAHWPVAAAVAAALAALVLPEVLRSWRPRATLTVAVDSVARALAGPSRLLRATWTGDVRMHLAWIVGGAILLTVLVLDMPAVAPTPAAAGQGIEISTWRDFFPQGGAGHVDISAANPHLVLVAAAVIILLIRLAAPRHATRPASVVAVAGVVAAAVVALRMASEERSDWHDMMGLMILDPWGVFALMTVLGTGLVAFVAGLPHGPGAESRPADIIAVALLALVGMAVAVVSTDFLTLFTGLALMTICHTILLGMQPRDPAATEATLKYFLTSLVTSGLFLFGVALLYGATGDTQFGGVAAGLAPALAPGSTSAALARLGLALVLCAAAWLVAAAPFHMHAIDVCHGGHGAASPLVAVGQAVTGLLVLVRLLHGPLAAAVNSLREPLFVLGAIAATVGALLAWMQQDRRRALGHVSVAVAGLLVMAFAGKMLTFETPGWVAFPLPVLLATYWLIALLLGRLHEAVPGGAAVAQAELLRRSVASGLALVLALVLALASVVIVLRSFEADVSDSAAVALVVGGAALVVAAGRMLLMFGRLAAGARAADSRTRFAAAGLVFVLLVLALVPLVFVEQIGWAVELTWPR